ncbi:alpha-amylase family glycosyl hydrolase [Chryseolinea sp. T2]|uniref:alpha-amylase family glycosyl hydrolase n=1 Tax=Chryseolinea sp. T2 TaxID=3129255 RepID=UPI003076BBCC
MRCISLTLAASLMALCACQPSRQSDENSDLLADGAASASDSAGTSFPELAKNMTIYEVNIRQHTEEGTFKAFQSDLPRLKKLGIGMLWIMPVQPIGEKNRKGTRGSYYSIKDYTSVNPEFGTLEDFKALVTAAHEQGFKVILDWVPNHTAWDHTWQTEHREFYMTDSAAVEVGRTLGVAKDYYKKKGVGNLVYEADWDDIALLNHYNEGTRRAMIDAMKFWITDTDIDGFRADHAGHEIPMFFWNEVMNELNPLKDLFWLAEWDEPRMHMEFDATYDWKLLDLTSHVAKGKATAEDIHEHIRRDVANYGSRAFRLNMINNHDENSWKGTVKERYGDGDRAFAVFSFTAYGTPLLYSGQEVGLAKRLKFFDKDTIPMNDPENYYAFYQKLCGLKANEPAIWSSEFGSLPEKLEDGNVHVFSFRRRRDGHELIGFINMTAKPQEVVVPAFVQAMKDVFTGKSLSSGKTTLRPWEYYILTTEQ